MMEVVTQSIEENRLPPIVVNGHCKLKQNGIVKCQETGMTEPEICRRPTPEGEESCILSETDQNSSLEKKFLPLQEDGIQKEGEEKNIEVKDDDGQENEIKDDNVQEKEIKDDNGQEKEIKGDDRQEKEIKDDAEKETEEPKVEDKTECGEEIEEELQFNKTAELVNIHSENHGNSEEELLESKITMNEKQIVPEIEITTCGENQVDDDIEEQKDENVESVLDREIRLQKEREESLAKERETAKMESVKSELTTESPPPKQIHNQIQPTERPYCTQTTESRIALEIREMREREEELKRMRNNIKAQTAEAETSETKASEINEEKVAVVEKKSPINETLNANLGMLKKKDRIKVRPLEDVEEENKPIYRMSKESPIEKEIRLLKEREEELRRDKGLSTPPKKSEIPPKVIKERTFAPIKQGGDTQRYLATNRIQQEIEEQTRRELDLRETGHIRTLSQDTAERPANGSICKSAKFLSCTGKENISNDVKEEDFTELKSSLVKKSKVDARFPLINRRNVSAESKIQQELLEMKAREEELRQQRLKISDQLQPNLSVSVNGNGRENSPERITSHLNLKDQNKMISNDVSINGRRRRSALIAQWEKRIQNAEGKS